MKKNITRKAILTTLTTMMSVAMVSAWQPGSALANTDTNSCPAIMGQFGGLPGMPEPMVTYAGKQIPMSKLPALQQDAHEFASRVIASIQNPEALRSAAQEVVIKQADEATDKVAKFLKGNPLLKKRDLSGAAQKVMAADGSVTTQGEVAAMSAADIDASLGKVVGFLQEFDNLGGVKGKVVKALGRIPLLGRAVGNPQDKILNLAEQIQMMDESLVRGIRSLDADNGALRSLIDQINSEIATLDSQVIKFAMARDAMETAINQLPAGDPRKAVFQQEILARMNAKVENLAALNAALLTAKEAADQQVRTNLLRMEQIADVRQVSVPIVTTASSVEVAANNSMIQHNKMQAVRDLTGRAVQRMADRVAASNAAQLEMAGQSAVDPDKISSAIKKLAASRTENEGKLAALLQKQSDNRQTMFAALEQAETLTRAGEVGNAAIDVIRTQGYLPKQ